MSGNETRVYEVTDVNVQILESEPPTLVVKSRGNVRTGGWTAPALSRVVYVIPPTDGIQDYDFYATPPAGGSTSALDEVEATDSWHDPPDWIRGVRVRAETNQIERKASIKMGAP